MPSKRLILLFIVALGSIQLLAVAIYQWGRVKLFVPFAIGVLVPFLMAWAQQRKQRKQQNH